MRLVLPMLAVALAAAVPAAAQVVPPGPTNAKPAVDPTPAGAAAEEVNTESLFGFTSGSDTDDAGALSGGLEFTGNFMRRTGRYSAFLGKLGTTYAVTDNFAATLNVFGGYRGIRGNLDMPNTNGMRFDGIGTEFRWRLLQRGPSPIGIAVQIEPALRTATEDAGRRGIGGAVENKLIIDTALVPEKVFAAINLIYGLETFTPSHAPTERASGFGVSGAVAVQVAPQVFLGGELRYMRAYEGLGLERFRGDAVFLGPTMFWQVAENVAVAAMFSAQLAGHAVGEGHRLDLVNFNRYQARVKVGVAF